MNIEDLVSNLMVHLPSIISRGRKKNFNPLSEAFSFFMLPATIIEHLDNTLAISGPFLPSVVFRSQTIIPSNCVSCLAGILLAATASRHGGNVTKLCRGSFAEVFKCEGTVGRFVSALVNPRYLSNSIAATEFSVSHDLLQVLCFGTVHKQGDDSLIGFMIFMDALSNISGGFDAEELIWTQVRKVAKLGFHNDLKFDNLMLSSSGDVRVIDFDFFHPTQIRLCVTAAETIVHDFESFFNQLSPELVCMFRAFYDYSYLSGSLEGTNPLYPRVLDRLLHMYDSLSNQGVLGKFVEYVGDVHIRDLPFELLVRAPNIDAVSIHLLDLRGNAFAHGMSDYESLPFLIKSSGVYWSVQN